MITDVVMRPIEGRDALLKRAEDCVIATLAVTLLSPLMLLIAVAIKLDSPGPVLFRQRRHGLHHRVFSVWKFRTMRVLEDGPMVTQARRGDDRITRIGRFLRMTSLDELPQLFNVLAGDMSIVGPRPHALAHNEHFAGMVAHYAERHAVKPGITGWAQIHGYRGPTETAEQMRRRVELDLDYIRHWSLWLDLRIVALTPFYGLMGRNAF